MNLLVLIMLVLSCSNEKYFKTNAKMDVEAIRVLSRVKSTPKQIVDALYECNNMEERNHLIGKVFNEIEKEEILKLNIDSIEKLVFLKKVTDLVFKEENELKTEIVNLLKQKKELINSKDEFGNSALHLAIQELNLYAVQQLIEAGANVNIQNKEGITPLMFLVINGSLKDLKDFYNPIFTLLKEKNVDINIKSNKGWTALGILISHNGTGWASIKYTEENKNKLRYKLKKAGANVNIQDNDGLNPLMIAIKYACTFNENPQIHIQSLILSLMSDLKLSDPYLEMKDNKGRTVLHYACMYGNEWLVKVLISEGIKLDIKDNDKKSALTLLKEKRDELYKKERHYIIEEDDALFARLEKLILKEESDQIFDNLEELILKKEENLN